MIRVFRATNARELKTTPDDAPLLEGATPAEILAALERSKLTKGEREAVQRACSQIGLATRDASLNILVAADGTIFRIERLARSQPAAPSKPRATDWLTAERDAVVVVFHDDAAWARRLVDGLRFLGYAARRADKATASALLAPGPAVVIAPANVFDGVLALPIDGSCGLVALLGEGEPAPPTVHATLSRPVQLGRVASVLDPIIRKAGTKRPRIERATPRP